jgi:hypothetical protein
MSFNLFEIFYIYKSRTLGNCDYVADIFRSMLRIRNMLRVKYGRTDNEC